MKDDGPRPGSNNKLHDIIFGNGSEAELDQFKRRARDFINVRTKIHAHYRFDDCGWCVWPFFSCTYIRGLKREREILARRMGFI